LWNRNVCSFHTNVNPVDSAYTIFNNALELSGPAERAAYLQEACAADAALRQRVEKLLQAHDEAGGFFSEPLKPNTSAGTSEGPVAINMEKAGDVIGRYKLLEQIGEGGCGVVYMAEQLEPVRRRVALKVIKLGMDTKQVVARFEAERQALAMMDYPSIARVLDAGSTSSGRPYFVMELVRGVKITEFCDRKKLSTEERLQLFIQVCQAVQHAHQKGIIHRDLKPSNILVTTVDGAPVPKVIDFGIAKATSNQPLTDKTLFTAFEQFIGTPAYMSPEQAEMSGVDIDTRTDLYSLGVVLYELLTGKTPFDAEELLRSGIDQIRRIIREQEPPKPSTRLHTLAHPDLTTTAQARHTDEHKLLQSVSGDLDWIVMKCLEKDRGRRYETVNGLATDIQRHLNNETVVARPPSRWYEFQKTVRRHKFGFAVTGAIILLMAVGIFASTWQAVRATRAEGEQNRLRKRAEANEKKAENEAAKSRQVATFLEDMLASVEPAVALGRDATMLREILDRAADRVGKDLKQQPEAQAQLQATIANTYLELGDFAKAEVLAGEALRIRRELFGETNELVADSLRGLAAVIHQHGKLAEAEMKHREALAIYEKLIGREHPKVAKLLYGLGGTLLEQGKHAEAEKVYREALAIHRSQSGDEQLAVADLLNEMVYAVHGQGKRSEAEAIGREALALSRRLVGEEHPSVATALLRLATVLGLAGKHAEAEELCRQSVAMRRRLLGNEHAFVVSGMDFLAQIIARQPNRQAEAEVLFREVLAMRKKRLGNEDRTVGESLAKLASLLEKQGKLLEAEEMIREELAIERKLSGNEHPFVANSLVSLANVLNKARRPKEAEPLLREALEICRKSVGKEHGDTAAVLASLASTLQNQGKHPEAESACRDLIRDMRARLAPDDLQLASPLATLTGLLFLQNNFTNAEATARECLAIREKAIPNDWLTFNARSLVGRSLLGQKKYTEAEPFLLLGYEGMKQRRGSIPVSGLGRVGETLQSLAKLYEDTGQPEKAHEWNQKLAEFESGKDDQKSTSHQP
jgi:eukaryotic-like serine/threonine-protein kinase